MLLERGGGGERNLRRPTPLVAPGVEDPSDSQFVDTQVNTICCRECGPPARGCASSGRLLDHEVIRGHEAFFAHAVAHAEPLVRVVKDFKLAAKRRLAAGHHGRWWWWRWWR